VCRLGEEDPCTFFAKIHFPVDEFFPPDSLDTPDGYREANGERRTITGPKAARPYITGNARRTAGAFFASRRKADGAAHKNPAGAAGGISRLGLRACRAAQAYCATAAFLFMDPPMM
jgi:hypothetical protein